MLAVSSAGFRGRQDLIEYLDRELEGYVEASQTGYPADEHLDTLVTVLVLGELPRALWARLAGTRRTPIPVVFLRPSPGPGAG